MAVLAVLTLGLTSCGDIDDNQECAGNDGCDEGFVCTADLVCKKRNGEPCVRPAECESTICEAGHCRRP
jgi:hypothetical protein